MSTLFEAAARLQSAGIAEELLLLAVRVTVLLLVGRLLLVALNRARPSRRSALASVTLAAALLLPLVTAVVPSWQASATLGRSSEPIGVSDTEESSLRTAISIARVTGVVPERPLSALGRATELVATTWKGWIAILAMTPSALLLLHALAGAFVARRQAQSGGAPTSLSVARLINRAAVAVYWFHPLAWSIEKQAILASEAATAETKEERSMPQTGSRGFGRRGFALAAVVGSLVLVPVLALRLIASSAPEAEATSRPTGSGVAAGSRLDVVGDLIAVGIARAAGRDALAIKPNDGDDWYERAWLLYRQNRHDEAAEAFTQAARMNYREPASLYNAACSHSLAGNRDNAIATLESALAAGWDDLEHIGEDRDLDALRDDPRFVKLLRNEAIATARLTKTLSRYEELQNAADEASGEEWLKVGSDLLSLRRNEEALSALQQALASGHMKGTVALDVARLASKNGEREDAMLWLDRAIENGFSSRKILKNDPDLELVRNDPRFEALVTKARDLEMRGCCDDGLLSLFHPDSRSGNAVEHHRRIAEKYPSSGRAWFNLGYTALQSKDFPTARQAYRRTIELNYRVGTSAYNMACAYALQKNNDAAFEWLERSRLAGFDLSRHLTRDRDLKSLRKDPRWDGLVAETKREKQAKKDRLAAFQQTSF